MVDLGGASMRVATASHTPAGASPPVLASMAAVS